jgi:hypothetical protein
MPQRYLADGRVPNHTLWRARTGKVERWSTVSEDDAALIQSWREAGALWPTPDHAFDDWYWMYATVVLGRRMDGVRPLVVTNDEMRDHAFRLATVDPALSRTLRKWKERHVLRCAFSHAALLGSKLPMPTIALEPPPPVAHEIHADERGERWHMPSALADTLATTPAGLPHGSDGVGVGAPPWLCARIRTCVQLQESQSESPS